MTSHPFSSWNTDEHVRIPPTSQGVKSPLELPWAARLRCGRQEIRGRSWSAYGTISRVGYSVDGGPWREARLVGPNVPGAWVRWGFAWDARPGGHEIRVRAVDEAGDAQPDAVGWNDLGYLYDGVVGHPVEVL